MFLNMLECFEKYLKNKFMRNRYGGVAKFKQFSKFSINKSLERNFS